MYAMTATNILEDVCEIALEVKMKSLFPTAIDLGGYGFSTVSLRYVGNILLLLSEYSKFKHHLNIYL